MDAGSPAVTDRRETLAAPEYLWDGSAPAPSHTYLLGPVLARLSAAGARKVLDLGCGNGAFAAALAHRGFDVTGLDQSASGIEAARYSYPGVPFVRGDVCEPLPAEHAGRFDAVVAVEVIEHLLLPRRLMEAALSALRPGGLLVVTTPYHGYLKNLALALSNGFDAHWHPLRDFGHVKFFSRRTLLALLGECGLRALQFSTAGRFPPLAKSMVVSGTAP